MNPISTVVAAAIRKSLIWLGRRGATVSRHVGHHTRRSASVALRNPRYRGRVDMIAGRVGVAESLAGRAIHTIFADPRPYKLIERALRRPVATRVKSNGFIVVEGQFNRAIGRNGERFIHILIDPRTGRIVQAFPIAQLGGTFFQHTAVGSVLLGAFDDRLDETLGGVERLAAAWRTRTPQDESVDPITWILDLWFDPAPAGDADIQGMHTQIRRYVQIQADAMIHEIETAAEMCLSTWQRDEIHKQFEDAVTSALME